MTQRILQKYYSKKFSGLIEKSLTEKNYEEIHEKNHRAFWFICRILATVLSKWKET